MDKAKIVVQSKTGVKESIIKSILDQGKFVTVLFKKKSDGTIRTLNCRKLPPVESAKPRKHNKNVIPVWDLKKGAYRSFDIDTVEEVRAMKSVIKFE